MTPDDAETLRRDLEGDGYNAYLRNYGDGWDVVVDGRAPGVLDHVTVAPFEEGSPQHRLAVILDSLGDQIRIATELRDELRTMGR